MTRRGLKPTGIAIFEAQGKGFASVGHYVQARAPRTPALCCRPRAGANQRVDDDLLTHVVSDMAQPVASVAVLPGMAQVSRYTDHAWVLAGGRMVP